MAALIPRRISVIIPALDEERHLPATLASVSGDEGVEVIVVDGQSTDATRAVARRAAARVYAVPRGRARQMNAGAAVATGEYLLFLHADTRLPAGFAGHVRRTLARPGIVAGAFDLTIDGPHWSMRVLERLVKFRSRRLRMPYGDQAIFLQTATFRAVGGFPELEIMEDFELVRRLRRQGRIALVAAPVVTSARRWRGEGLLRTTFVNQCILAGHLLGISSARLARWRPRHQPPARSSPIGQEPEQVGRADQAVTVEVRGAQRGTRIVAWPPGGKQEQQVGRSD